MKASKLIIALAIFGSWSVHSKTFKFTNPETAQSMSVFCFNPSSLQCQKKKEEVRQRLLSNSNPASATLSAARASDSYNHVKTSVSDDASQAREGITDTATKGSDAVIGFGKKVIDTVSEKAGDGIAATRALGSRVSDSVKDSASQGAAATRDMGSRASDSVSSGLSQGVDATRGFGSRVSESVSGGVSQGVEATKGFGARVSESVSGGVSRGVEATQGVGGAVAEKATGATRSVGSRIQNGITRMNHGFCQRKLARHAKEFDNSYRISGRELISFEVKMDHIKEELESAGELERCQEHYDNALLGYQLKWAAGGETDSERTHIFDGLGRLADGKVGYWTNEERSASQSSATQR